MADAKKHAAFTIAVPATADTAAEVTIGYLVADPDKVRKFVCVDVSDIPDVEMCIRDSLRSSWLHLQPNVDCLPDYHFGWYDGCICYQCMSLHFHGNLACCIRC